MPSLRLLALILLFAATATWAQTEPLFALYLVAEPGTTGAKPFRFVNAETDKLATGVYFPGAILLASDLKNAKLEIRQAGTAPLAGVSLAFQPQVRRLLGRPSMQPVQHLLVVFNGQPRALVGLNELRRLVSRDTRLFVPIAHRTRAEVNELTRVVDHLNASLPGRE